MTQVLRGGHGGPVEATVRCTACSHPLKVHNADGCVMGNCECVEAHRTPGAPRVTAPAAPAAAPARDPLAGSIWFSARWYCPRCHDWPRLQGECEQCGGPLQPVYLATFPREI